MTRQKNLSDALVEEQLFQYGVTISPSSRDGDCSFHSIAENILAWKQRLKRIGILTYTQENLSTQLREALVNEVIGERWQQYQGFTTDVISNYEAEAKKFWKMDTLPAKLAILCFTGIHTYFQKRRYQPSIHYSCARYSGNTNLPHI